MFILRKVCFLEERTEKEEKRFFKFACPISLPSSLPPSLPSPPFPSPFLSLQDEHHCTNQSAPFGLLRSKEEDEKILKEYRICEHILSTPFEAITFDDMRFKHDGDCLLAEKPSEKAWRSVMLVMARRPLSVPSPLDGRVIDGFFLFLFFLFVLFF